jgi:hypothetical protein
MKRLIFRLMVVGLAGAGLTGCYYDYYEPYHRYPGDPYWDGHYYYGHGHRYYYRDGRGYHGDWRYGPERRYYRRYYRRSYRRY